MGDDPVQQHPLQPEGRGRRLVLSEGVALGGLLHVQDVLPHVAGALQPAGLTALPGAGLAGHPHALPAGRLPEHAELPRRLGLGRRPHPQSI